MEHYFMPPYKPDYSGRTVRALSLESLTLRAVLALVLGIAAVFVVAVAYSRPFSVPMPGYMVDIKAWSPSVPIADTFTPLACPLLLAPAFDLAGIRGIVVVEAAFYLVTVAVAFILLSFLEVPPRIAGLATLLILLHPEILLSVVKVWDVGLSTCVFLLLLLVSLIILRLGATLGPCLALGFVLGFSLFCRPNFALLVPAILYGLWRAPAKPSGLRFTSIFLVAAVTFAFAGIAAHGRPFWPRNGAYNFYAGNNPFSSQVLLEKLNGEPSIMPALRAAHSGLVPDTVPQDFYYSPALQPIYTHDAVAFVVHHPGEQIRLIGIKLMTLFRPDTKVHPLRSAPGLCKAALALPAPILLILLLSPGRPPLESVDWLLIALAIAYILPFLLTNSEPRFRTPLDALIILHAVRLVFLRFTTQLAANP